MVTGYHNIIAATPTDPSAPTRPCPQPRPASGSPLDEHDTSEFCWPDPLSRPASSVAGGLARPLASVSKCRSNIDGHPHAPAHTIWL